MEATSKDQELRAIKPTCVGLQESKLLELLGTDHSFAEIAKAMRLPEDEVARWVADIGRQGRAQAKRLKATEELQRANRQRRSLPAAFNFTPMPIDRARLMRGR